MKANEAPEKIYILNHEDYSDRRILNAFTEKEDNTDIKYIRTDAFIEKACKWLADNARAFDEGDIYNAEDLVEYFRDYMKGE